MAKLGVKSRNKSINNRVWTQRSWTKNFTVQLVAFGNQTAATPRIPANLSFRPIQIPRNKSNLRTRQSGGSRAHCFVSKLAEYDRGPLWPNYFGLNPLNEWKQVIGLRMTIWVLSKSHAKTETNGILCGQRMTNAGDYRQEINEQHS
jgi:hypothetical protein